MKSIEHLKHRYSAENPLSPPDRRYRLVKACFKRGVQPPVGDRFTWELFSYLREREAAYEPSAEVRVQRTWWELVAALSLHRGESQNLRPIIEAFLLADEKPQSIAARLAVPVNAIQWFRVIFSTSRPFEMRPFEFYTTSSESRPKPEPDSSRTKF